MRVTYNTGPLLKFLHDYGDATNPEHQQLKANVQSAYDCNSANVLLTEEEHHVVARLEIENRTEQLMKKEPANDDTQT